MRRMFGPTLLALIVAMALLSFVWTPWDVAPIDVAHRLQPGSFAHPLGTDQLGRDLLSMLMVAATVIASFLTDVVQALLDPRLRKWS